VTDIFVPEERTLLFTATPDREPGPLYRFPRTHLFASGDAATALGVARSSLEAFLELAGAKTPYRTKALLRDQPLVQFDVGHAEALVRSGRALLMETIGEVWEGVSAAGAISLDQRASLRLAATHAIRLSAQVVDTVYNLAGASAIFESSPLQRYFQDIHVITQHIQSRRNNYELVGRFHLGLDVDLQRL
jgi:alkylation response protein AidB-like acyl-CoA dehydrogenase